jgi:hypothetical protein
MSERETVVELPFAADCCPCVEKLRTVLPLMLGGGGGVCVWSSAAFWCWPATLTRRRRTRCWGSSTSWAFRRRPRTGRRSR